MITPYYTFTLIIFLLLAYIMKQYHEIILLKKDRRTELDNKILELINKILEEFY